MIFVEQVEFGEILVGKIKGGEDIELFVFPVVWMEDGTFVLAIVIKNVVGAGDFAGVDGKKWHQGHVLVNHAFWEEKIMVQNELATNEKLPRAKAIHDKAAAPGLICSGNGVANKSVTVWPKLFGRKRDEVDVFFFG